MIKSARTTVILALISFIIIALLSFGSAFAYFSDNTKVTGSMKFGNLEISLKDGEDIVTELTTVTNLVPGGYLAGDKDTYKSYTVDMSKTNIDAYIRVKIDCTLQGVAFKNAFNTSLGEGWFLHSDGFYYQTSSDNPTSNSIADRVPSSQNQVEIKVKIQFSTTVEGAGYMGKSGSYSVTVQAIQASYLESEDRDVEYTISELSSIWGGGVSVGDVFIVEDNVLVGLTSYGLTVSEATVPDNVDAIAANAFDGATRLTKLSIPESVTSIEANAFLGATALSEVSFENAYLWYHTTSDDNTGGTQILSADLKQNGASYLTTDYSEESWYQLESNLPDDWISWDSNRSAYYISGGSTTLEPELVIPNSYNDGEHGEAGITYIDAWFSEHGGPRGAFVYNSDVISIVFPTTLEYIDHYTFYECPLKYISFAPNSQITSIRETFYSAESIFVPATITNGDMIGDNIKEIIVEEGNPVYTSRDANGNYCNALINHTTNTLEKGTPTSIIPNGIVAIADSAFEYCDELTNITIPFSVMNIGASAFSGCTSLTSVIFEGDSKLISMGSYAFNYCTSLTSVVFEGDSQLVSIDNYAFQNCTSLTSMTIPSSVSGIGYWAFGDSGLQSLVLEDTANWHSTSTKGDMANATLVSSTELQDPTIAATYFVSTYASSYWYKSGVNYLQADRVVWSDQHNAYIIVAGASQVPDNLIIPSTYNDGVHGEANIVAISDSAFDGCSNLASITIPSSVISIGSWVFSNCSNLASATFEEGSQLTSIGDYAFCNCTSLTSITIPSSVTSIGSWVFSDCSNLASVTFEEGSQLTSIGEYAFCNCTSLTSITIPSSVTSIGEYAFKGCNSLENITIPSSVTSIGSWVFSDCSNLASVTFEEGSQLSTIGSYAFYNCTSLTSITIPLSVTSIGNYAFSGCSNLTNVTFEGNSQLTSTVTSAFKDCANLNVTISAGVTSIGDSAFKGFSNLASVTFEEGSQLTSIESYAFYNCTNLTSITIPSSVTSIGDYAFRACSNLASVTFEEGSQLTSIGSRAFYNCTNLTSITIPSSVTSIGNYAFYGCSGLESVTFEEGLQLLSIGDGAFFYCSGLESVTIPLRVTSIGSYAFSGCSNLTNVTFEGNSQLTSTVAKGFRYCANLNVTISAGVTSIGDSAFEGFSNLASVTFEEGSQLTSIGYRAFYNCTKLTSITIPSSVTSIGRSAFGNCSNLQTVTFEGSENWHITSSSSYTGGSTVNVNNSSANAKLLTDTYSNHYWYKD